jgi:uncharacterized protein YndB with AHSA1/START domain
MATATTTPAPARAATPLRVTRTFPASRERVFRAWTDPQVLACWFAPSDDFQTSVFELDLRPGGRYRIEMLQGGTPHRVAGTYVEIHPPEKLAFTWKWENETAHAHESLVTLEFFDRDGSTELVLTHDRIADAASRDEHNKGWIGCLDRLGKHLAGSSDILHRITIEAPPERILQAISTEEGFRAWWTDDCAAVPRAGTVNVFRFHSGAVEFLFRVDELSPSRVSWTCLAGPKVPAEWVGTRVTFDLAPAEGGGTVLRFGHRGWRSVEGEYPACNTVWGDLMHRLKALAEGKPRGPYFV